MFGLLHTVPKATASEHYTEWHADMVVSSPAGAQPAEVKHRSLRLTKHVPNL